MDQLKALLKQAAKYRFWIVVVVASLLPMIAYFASTGKLQAETTAEAGKIKNAKTDVQQYLGVPNPDATTHVNEEVSRISKDVNKTWRELYDRQAPLLTWPSTVGDTFTKWGPKWPGDKVDPSQIQTQIGFYIQGYPAYVEDVYKKLGAWDAEEGKGIVIAPPSDVLLRPATFDISTPPTLGKVWAAQERLWLQATLIDVVTKVNKDATDWDSAKIKAITGLEVGSSSPDYLDQQSIAKGEKLKEDEDPDPAAKKKAAPAGAGGASPAGKMSFPGMPGADGGMPGMPGADDKAASSSIFHVDAKNAPYRLYPVYLSVLIEQNAMLDLLAEMEKSPMAIQVRDFEMSRPEVRVVKPVKGQDTSIAFGGGGSSLGVLGMGGGMPGMPGMGGATGTPRLTALEMLKKMGGAPGMPGAGGMPVMGGGAGGVVGGKEGHKVVQKKKDEAAEKKGPPPKVEIFDPYYNVVEVKVYGLARIYNPPPPLPAGPASSPASPTTSPPASPSEPTIKPETKVEPAQVEPAKPEPAKPEPVKTEPAKAEPAKVESQPAAPNAEPEKKKGPPEPSKPTNSPAPKS